MKRLCLYILLPLCLVLGGCGTKAEEKAFRDFSEALSQRDDLSFIGTIRAEYDERSESFRLLYEQDGDMDRVTVQLPELIEGISVRLKEGASVLEYNSLVIDTGNLDERGLSPLTALPELARALRGAYIDAVRKEDSELVYTLIPEDGLCIDVWFEPGSMTPTHAELISDGVVRVFCDIESWR